ncbi:MAG: hypothetical protein NWT00_11900 [Beijerinckiaceae bacterium]|nr:hypothetical protein [Beijerinckiaceae bacterium]
MQSRIDAVQWPTSFEDYHESGLPPRQISFSFQTDRPSDLNANSWTDVSGWGSYTESEKQAVRTALDIYEDYINVQFVETDIENTVDFTFLRASEGVSGGRGRFQSYA